MYTKMQGTPPTPMDNFPTMQVKSPMTGAMPNYGASAMLATSPRGGTSSNVGVSSLGAGAPAGGSLSSPPSVQGTSTPDKSSPNYGGIWDAISRIFGSQRGNVDFTNPAHAAMPYFDQIEGRISPYYNPYVSAGAKSLPELQKIYAEMYGDPSAFMKKIGAGFKESPGYQYNVDQATKAANAAAAASGMLGTPAEQAELAKTVHGLADQDFNTYMDRALGVHGRGVGGLENINNMGYRASDTMANNIANILAQKGNLAYSGAANQNLQNMIKAMIEGRQQDSLFGGIGDLINSFTGNGKGGFNIKDLLPFV